MTLSSIGDMRQHLAMTRNTTQLKIRMNTLTDALSSGEIRDKVRAMGGETARLDDIDRHLKLADSHLRATVGTAQKLGMTQQVLGSVDDIRNTLTQAFLPVSATSTDVERAAAASRARVSVGSILSQLNSRYGDETLLAGNATDRAAVADEATLMADIGAALAGAVTAQDVIDTIDAYFDTPGGGFETNIYTGDTGGPVERPIGLNETVRIDARADDPSRRSILGATVMAAVVDAGYVALSGEEESRLIREAGTRMLTAAKPLADMRGRLAGAEQLVEEARVRAQASEAAFTIARNELVAADPHETATELQAVQTQLETHYVLTARLARLSLTEYI